MYKLFELDGNTWNYIAVQIICIRKEYLISNNYV